MPTTSDRTPESPDENDADAVEPVVEDQVRVLVVEDEESYRLALESALRLEGYHVEVATDGADGIARFIEHIPDIVLLDLLLPDTYGTDLLRRMHAIAPVPVLIISAVNAELDVVLGLELGAADYVTKPFRLRELVARMHTILRRVSPPGAVVDKPPAHRRAHERRSGDCRPSPGRDGGGAARHPLRACGGELRSAPGHRRRGAGASLST